MIGPPSKLTALNFGCAKRGSEAHGASLVSSRDAEERTLGGSSMLGLNWGCFSAERAKQGTVGSCLWVEEAGQGFARTQFVNELVSSARLGVNLHAAEELIGSASASIGRVSNLGLSHGSPWRSSLSTPLSVPNDVL